MPVHLMSLTEKRENSMGELVDLSDTTAVNEFRARAQNGMTIEELHKQLFKLYEGRSDEEMEAWYFSRGKAKQIMDEVGPVARMLRVARIAKGTVAFPFDDNPPDCWLYREGKSPIGIEVTIAQGRERHLLAEERKASKNGITRGRIALLDSASKHEIEAAKESRREMYSTQSAINILAQSIRLCLSKKASVKYKGMYLVIDANMLVLPPDRWKYLMPGFKPEVEKTSFRRVYLVGRSPRSGWLRLK